MGNLSSMRNIGNEMERKLKSVDISSPEELATIGSKAAFIRLKARYPEVCLVHLYTLQAAIEGIDMQHLPEETKRDLKAYSDSLK